MSTAGEFSTGSANSAVWTDNELAELHMLAEKPCKIHLLCYLYGKLGDGRQYVNELLEQLEAEGGYCKECYDVIMKQRIVIQNMGVEICRLEKEAAYVAFTPAKEVYYLKNLNIKLRGELYTAYANNGDLKTRDDSSVQLALDNLAEKTERVEELEELVLSLKSQCRLLRQQLEMYASYTVVQTYASDGGAAEKLAHRSYALRKAKLQAQYLKGHIFALRSSIYAARICALDYLGRLYTDYPEVVGLQALLRGAK